MEGRRRRKVEGKGRRSKMSGRRTRRRRKGRRRWEPAIRRASP